MTPPSTAGGAVPGQSIPAAPPARQPELRKPFWPERRKVTGKQFAIAWAALWALAWMLRNFAFLVSFSGYNLNDAHQFCTTGVWIVCGDVNEAWLVTELLFATGWVAAGFFAYRAYRHLRPGTTTRAD
jgi:hypothetical protein